MKTYELRVTVRKNTFWEYRMYVRKELFGMKFWWRIESTFFKSLIQEEFQSYFNNMMNPKGLELPKTVSEHTATVTVDEKGNVRGLAEFVKGIPDF